MPYWGYEAALDYFRRISGDKKNDQVMEETARIPKLRAFVVEQLIKIENGPDCPYWWQNKELVNMFLSLNEIGGIELPKESVEKYRWIALVCIVIAELEGFSYGNVLIPADYLPEEKLAEQELIYGVGVIEDIKGFRNDLLS